MTYVLVGRYCPTDANPETDIPADAPWVAIPFVNRQDAESWPDRFWYPPMIVAEIAPDKP